MTDCRSCKDYRECIGKEWFHFGEIRWCPYQCIFILANADTFRAGHWPQDPDRADNNLGQRSIKTEASFVKPELILAEVESRLESAPNKGELLITQVEDGRTFETLSDGARAILMYIKGWRRKAISFRKWQWQREQRKNEDILSSKLIANKNH